jgi:hypothetical protein
LHCLLIEAYISSSKRLESIDSRAINDDEEEEEEEEVFVSIKKEKVNSFFLMRIWIYLQLSYT